MSVKTRDEVLNPPMFDTILPHGPLQSIHHEMKSTSDMDLERNGEREVLVSRGLTNWSAADILQLEPSTEAMRLWSLQFAYSFEVAELHCHHVEELIVPFAGFKWTVGLNHSVKLHKARLKAQFPVFKLLDNRLRVVLGLKNFRSFSLA